jgi:SAM-dependent methyltransferase
MPTLDQSRTKAAYALQWNRYRIIRPEEDRATFFSRTGLLTSDLSEAIVLDAGCGMGRYLRIAAESPARLIVGMDLSEAVTAARELTASGPAIAILQGDLLRPPFAPATFDHIYSLGAIDHTPDPSATFLALARLLKPGGRIVIWVYPRERRVIEWIMNVQRAISTRLPLRLLEQLCRISAPVGGLKRRLMASRFKIVERIGVALHLSTIGVSMHPDAEVRICDTFDWYAPRYLSRHSVDDVVSWFAAAGLSDVVDLSRNQTFFHAGQGNGVNIAGRRPSTGPAGLVGPA